MTDPRNSCPVCKLEDQKVDKATELAHMIRVECSRCGDFTISKTPKLNLDGVDKSAQLSGWLRERKLLQTEVPVLTPAFLERVLGTLPKYSTSEKQLKLLKALEVLTEYPGQAVPLIPEHDVALVWAETEEEFTFYAETLLERGLVKRPRGFSRSMPLYTVLITAAGWTYLEQHQSELSEKTQAFIAMSFDPVLTAAYEQAIVPAVETTGFRPYRVDAAPHLHRIDVKIMAEIRNSRFMVADVTQQRPGVYYEAGFAHGLGLPVIWCVERSDLENVHFDTRQYNHIVWETNDELEDNLRDFILATIGGRRSNE